VRNKINIRTIFK
jgi:hypothetical protein